MRCILVSVPDSESHGRTTLADYRTALSTPRARRPMVASLLARLPIAMIGISALLYVQHQTGSFAIAGLVSASALLGVSVGSVVQGRIIDRFGPTRPLLLVSTVFAVIMTGLVLAIEAKAPSPVLIALAAGIGISEPMTGTASRALWGRLLPAGSTRNAAFSYEAISMEVFFILGPGLAGVLVTAPWPGTGIVLGASCMITGAVMFALSPAVREWGPAEKSKRRLLGALASPGMRTLALAALGFGIVLGFVEVAVPAAAEAAGHLAIGGLLLSLWSVSSVGFGIAYSLKPWPRTMRLRLPVLLAVFGVLVAMLALPTSLWGLALALLAAGALITPQSTTHSTTIEIVAPKGTAAEAFGWVLTSITLGLALGQSVSGYLSEHYGPPSAFVAAAVCALVVSCVVWFLRGTIRQPLPDESRGASMAA
ncbi:MFS transporter [Prauserella marina]|uniref:Predicted arabinose efflux permease, MFS family n=1 Tax=Prauserella marina TaxID=530584 RepID=A0A222VWQ4_9PSEU|nr:MFS transporter [Prauserella marina]ASR38406.1 MFS transporter [Prauserella marina]PWV78361.1 putative MFS family arabinose efflux permease [Prauserella marina]SDC84298.1 Predicted arabinose efflux permease, MFS family [Prauserella marina]